MYIFKIYVDHKPGPGLKSLQSLSQQLVAEEQWEAQAEGDAAEAASCLPRLHAMVLAQVRDQDDLLRLAATLSSMRPLISKAKDLKGFKTCSYCSYPDMFAIIVVVCSCDRYCILLLCLPYHRLC